MRSKMTFVKMPQIFSLSRFPHAPRRSSAPHPGDHKDSLTSDAACIIFRRAASGRAPRPRILDDTPDADAMEEEDIIEDEGGTDEGKGSPAPALRRAHIQTRNEDRAPALRRRTVRRDERSRRTEDHGIRSLAAAARRCDDAMARAMTAAPLPLAPASTLGPSPSTSIIASPVFASSTAAMLVSKPRNLSAILRSSSVARASTPARCSASALASLCSGRAIRRSADRIATASSSVSIRSPSLAPIRCSSNL
mmetsp:Transcript_2058/g.5421  ORF Transcript_2058/g.5421 Transcript_2058/m.5421 type:complete len:251 (-) Transcript_2058:519-1271(-)